MCIWLLEDGRLIEAHHWLAAQLQSQETKGGGEGGEEEQTTILPAPIHTSLRFSAVAVADDHLVAISRNDGQVHTR